MVGFLLSSHGAPQASTWLLLEEGPADRRFQDKPLFSSAVKLVLRSNDGWVVTFPPLSGLETSMACCYWSRFCYERIITLWGGYSIPDTACPSPAREALGSSVLPFVPCSCPHRSCCRGLPLTGVLALPCLQPPDLPGTLCSLWLRALAHRPACQECPLLNPSLRKRDSLFCVGTSSRNPLALRPQPVINPGVLLLSPHIKYT